MEQPANRSRTAHADPPEKSPSLGRLLVVSLLVGFSLAGLGSDLLDVISVSLPVSSMGGGLVFGAAAVSSLWVAGFRPSLGASGAYFLGQLLASLLLTGAFVAVVGSGASPEPWHEVGLRGLSIGLTATLCFTGVGGRVGNWVRRRGRTLLRVPPADDSGNA